MKWWSRFQKYGVDGLKSLSKKPYSSPNKNLTQEIKSQIFTFRKSSSLSARRIQSELLRNKHITLALATIHKVLKIHDVEPIGCYRGKPYFKSY